MWRRISWLAVVMACGATPTSDDTVDPTGDASTTAEDPTWEPDSPLPPELDFPPYLNLLDGTTVVVSWRTVAPSTGVVRFGTTAAFGDELATSTAANLHHVVLANLTAGAAYHYEVGIDGTSVKRGGVFVMPGRAHWRFVSFGEFHAPSESTGVALFAASIREFRPHVLLESGDMVDLGTSLANWRSYFRTSAPWISNVLLIPAHSNHVNGDGGNANLMDLVVVANNERWFTTRYGQAEFFSLDSTFDANADVESGELPWLAGEVALAHDGLDDPTFVIGAWHYPACSSQYASRSNARAWVQNNLVKTFKDNGGVDLILAAHDKYFERSTITGGIVHLITNIGNVSPEIPSGNHPDCTSVTMNRTTRSTALFTLDGSTLSAKVIDETGAELDTFAIAK
ncbi:MAG: fibronectin type III domain-containing protein [Kofleriaceae bacterium]